MPTEVEPADLVTLRYSLDMNTGRLRAKGWVSPFATEVDLDEIVGPCCPCSECIGALLKEMCEVDGLGRVGGK